MADEGIGNAMATGFASALSEGQPAQLDLGEEAVPCVVVGFSGAEVVLAPGAALPDEGIGAHNISFLLIEAGGTLHALKAHVREGFSDGELVATLLDPFRLQRRMFSRAPLVLPAHLRPLGSEDAPATSFTRDISAGGLRVARQSSYQPADMHEVVLGLVQAGREIKATAETVRATDRDVSLRFVEVSAEDRLILAQLTFAYPRRSAA
jgi:PilZ domain